VLWRGITSSPVTAGAAALDRLNPFLYRGREIICMVPVCPVGCGGLGVFTLLSKHIWSFILHQAKEVVKMIWSVGLCCEEVHGVPVPPSCVAVFKLRTDYKPANPSAFLLGKTCCAARAHKQSIARPMEPHGRDARTKLFDIDAECHCETWLLY